jgi:S-adenosylmethionine synthetase
MTDNHLLLEELNRKPVAQQRIELIERKGKGHPDSICDAVAEAVSLALCRDYQATFGCNLHHNTDKALFVAGRTQPQLGAGQVIEPIAVASYPCGEPSKQVYHDFHQPQRSAIAENQ